MRDTYSDLPRTLHTIGGILALPTLLKHIGEMTELGFIGIARVTDTSWTACAVHDSIGFGLEPGAQLDVGTTFCAEVRRSRTPIVIDHASADARYCDHLTPKIYGFESMVTVPIILRDGDYFGALFGIDRRPIKVSEPWVIRLFTTLAEAAANLLDDRRPLKRSNFELKVECGAVAIRDNFIDLMESHLRRPVHEIYETATGLEKYSKDLASIELARRMKKNARRVSASIDDVVDYTRARFGTGIEIHTEEAVDIEQLLRTVLQEQRHAHAGRIIIGNIAAGCTLRCDPLRMSQLATLLLGFCLEHSAPRGPVSFSASVDADSLTLTVWDDGEPIPAADITKIFNACLFPAHTTRRHEHRLGLHICSLIARAHQGYIVLTSTKAHGTEFVVTLPRCFAA